MGKLNINEIPLDTFLKYFDENTVNENSRKIMSEQLTSVFRSTTDANGNNVYYSGNMTNTTLAQITGFSATIVTDALTAGDEIKYINADNENDIIILALANDNGGYVIKFGGQTYSNENPVFDGYRDSFNGGDIYIRQEDVGYSIQLSINGYLWDASNRFHVYDYSARAYASTKRSPAYYGISNYSSFISYYPITIVYYAENDAAKTMRYMQGTKTGESYASIFSQTGIQMDGKVLNTSTGLDSSITVWDIPEANDGDGRVIYRIIENPETIVPKRSASGYYMYQDDLGVISLSADNDSNFKRHQNMVRAGYYDIRSMEEEFQNKIPPYTLGCIQKGASYLFEYYGKYYKDTYYFKKRIAGDYPDNAQLSLLSSDEYANSEKNGTAGLYRYSQVEYKNSVVALNSEKLRSIDVIYDGNKNYSGGYVYTDVLVDLPVDYSGALSSTENFLLTPYMREYRLFPSSASAILPLTSRIAVSATTVKTSNIEGTITSTTSSTSNGDISITTRRKGAAKSFFDLYDSVGTLKYGKNSATIKVGLGRLASTMYGYFKVYNVDGSNPYILLPLYLEDDVQRLAAATSGDNSGYLSYMVQIDGVAFDLVEDGGSLYLERESDSRRFALYSVTEASERFSWTMSMDGLEEKDVHVLQLYIDSITKTRLTDKQILGKLDVAEVIDTDPITGEKKIDSESFRTVMPYEYDSGVCGGMLNNSDFSLASNFKDVAISSANSLKKYLAELAADDTATAYSAVFVPASSKSSTGTIYYISKSTLANIEDTSEIISVFDVYYDDFQYTKSDSEEYTGNKRITYSSKETKIYFLDDIALDIYTANDTYYIGRKNVLEEKIYYKNKKAAIKSLLMKAINNPYGTADMTDMMADANHFDEARVFAGGLYSFVSNDRAHMAADATSVRDLTSISSLEDSTSIYQYQDNDADSAAEDISLYEANGSMTAEELTALSEFSGAARLLKYKEYPTYQQYLNTLKASAETRDALEATTDSEYQNIDVEKYYQSGEYKYYKDLDQTYSPRAIYRKDFATALTATVYKYATSNRNTPASGISTDDTHKNYAKTMELIKSKVISASNAKSKQGASTKKMKLADADHGDVEALITALFNGAAKLK